MIEGKSLLFEPENIIGNLMVAEYQVDRLRTSVTDSFHRPFELGRLVHLVVLFGNAVVTNILRTNKRARIKEVKARSV